MSSLTTQYAYNGWLVPLFSAETSALKTFRSSVDRPGRQLSLGDRGITNYTTNRGYQLVRTVTAESVIFPFTLIYHVFV